MNTLKQFLDQKTFLICGILLFVFNFYMFCRNETNIPAICGMTMGMIYILCSIQVRKMIHKTLINMTKLLERKL